MNYKILLTSLLVTNALTASSSSSSSSSMPHGIKRKNEPQEIDNDVNDVQTVKRAKTSHLERVLENSKTLKEFIEHAMASTRATDSSFTIPLDKVRQFTKDDPTLCATDARGNTILHAAANLRSCLLIKHISEVSKVLRNKINNVGMSAYDVYRASCRTAKAAVSASHSKLLEPLDDSSTDALPKCTTWEEFIALAMANERPKSSAKGPFKALYESLYHSDSNFDARDGNENTILHAVANLRSASLIQDVIKNNEALVIATNAANETVDDVYRKSCKKAQVKQNPDIFLMPQPTPSSITSTSSSEIVPKKSNVTWKAYIELAMATNQNNKEKFAQLQAMYKKLRHDNAYDRTIFGARDSMDNNCLHAFARLNFTQLIEKFAKIYPTLKNKTNMFGKKPLDIYCESCANINIPPSKNITAILKPLVPIVMPDLNEIQPAEATALATTTFATKEIRIPFSPTGPWAQWMSKELSAETTSPIRLTTTITTAAVLCKDAKLARTFAAVAAAESMAQK